MSYCHLIYIYFITNSVKHLFPFLPFLFLLITAFSYLHIFFYCNFPLNGLLDVLQDYFSSLSLPFNFAYDGN